VFTHFTSISQHYLNTPSCDTQISFTQAHINTHTHAHITSHTHAHTHTSIHTHTHTQTHTYTYSCHTQTEGLGELLYNNNQLVNGYPMKAHVSNKTLTITQTNKRRRNDYDTCTYVTTMLNTTCNSHDVTLHNHTTIKFTPWIYNKIGEPVTRLLHCTHIHVVDKDRILLHKQVSFYNTVNES
jgi:hypothetical protein